MTAVGIRRDTPPGVSGVRAGIFADTRGRVSLHIVRKKQGLLQVFCNKPLLIQMPRNSFQPAMKSLAWVGGGRRRGGGAVDDVGLKAVAGQDLRGPPAEAVAMISRQPPVPNLIILVPPQ